MSEGRPSHEASALPTSRLRLLGEPLAVGALALLVRLVGIRQGPVDDELYHVLAARSYLSSGTLSIAGGPPYDRAEAFTHVVAASLQLFGDSLEAARIPSLLAGTLVVVLAFWWLRGVGERAAAWVAALLLTFSPDGIELSQWVRFYSAQHLLALLGAVAAYQISVPPRKALRLGAWGLVLLLSLRSAYYLQPSSLIAAAGVGLYLGLLLLRAFFARPMPLLWRAVLSGAGVILGCVAAWIVVTSDFGRNAWSQATYTDAWAEYARYEIRFYHWYLVELYPTLWTTLPVLAVLAARRQPRVTLACLCVFGVAFLAHSLVAWKANRYFYYALPPFFVLCGLGIAAAAPPLWKGLRELAAAVTPPRWPASIARGLAGLGAAAMVAFLLASNYAFVATARLLQHATRPELYTVDRQNHTMAWGLAAERLGPEVAATDVFITGRDTKALFFFGRADYMLTRDKLYDGSGQHPEFFREENMRIPVISSPESIERIMACHRTGLILVERWQTTTEVMIPAASLALIRARTEPVPLPDEWGLLAFRWQHAPDPGARCPPESPATTSGD